jgi:hypothetical protein
MLEIDDIIESKNIDYEELRSRIKIVWDKIKKLRERSLEEEGEYGIGNLVFKLLRRNNYLGKIMDLKKNAYDKQFESKSFSFFRFDEEYTEESILNFLYKIEKLNNELPSDESWSQYINYTIDEDNFKIKVEMGASGYSEGWSEDWNIDYSDPEYIVVDRFASQSGPYGSSEDKKEFKFHSFNELYNEIKENF